MSQLKKTYSYESQLESLSATFDIRKKKFEKTQHLLTDEDRSIEKFLFSLETDASSKKEPSDREIALFNFDDYIGEKPVPEAILEYSDPTENQDVSNFSASERKHMCMHDNCNKSYTSSHGLKYHLLHGHSKEKENIYKPFVCVVPGCNKSYRNSNGLKYHMANAHVKERQHL